MVVLPKISSNQSNLPLFCNPFFERENNMYWLHCNACYRHPEAGVNLRFFITNCSHIYCEKCVTASTKECCKICKAQCTTLELSEKIGKELQSLFEEPAAILQKAVKKVSQVIEFQRSHQRRLNRHLRDMEKQRIKQLNGAKNLMGNFQTLQKELMELKKENSYLKCLVAKKDPGNRAGSRWGGIPGNSPTQTMFRRSPSGSPLSHGHTSSASKSTNVLFQPGRILMTTPPSEGRLGTTRSRSSYLTPESIQGEDMSMSRNSPMSIPRPLNLNGSQ